MGTVGSVFLWILGVAGVAAGIVLIARHKLDVLAIVCSLVAAIVISVGIVMQVPRTGPLTRPLVVFGLVVLMYLGGNLLRKLRKKK